MNCPNLAVIEQYISGRLKTIEQTEFEKHIELCSVCKAATAEAHQNKLLLDELRTFGSDNLISAKQIKNRIDTIARAQEILGNRYKVVQKIGEGSSGKVFQAVDTTLDRPVAVKFLQANDSNSQAGTEIWHEAKLMSQFNHPNIAHIYEVCEAGSQRFIVMEWVDGRPLTEAWKELNLQQRLRLYCAVLDAVAAAHHRGIIHRDIKPSNILVTADFIPKVLDFGIAVKTCSLGMIAQGLYRGTPAYSAPEQISQPVKISTATDVFALGVLLYQLLTDTLPFPQTDPKELFNAIRIEYPELPSAVQEKIPIPLQNICLKSLEKNPSQRYTTAQNLSDDVNRYLRGEKVWSRPSFLVDKVQQEVFHHRQKLSVWHSNQLITQKEFDKLENIYERMITPPDPSIIEARQLSLSQVCLYLGGWIAVLGSFVLFYKSWEQIPILWRPMPALAATALMAALGITMWKRNESRLAVGFLATANLLIPIAVLLMLGQWHILPASHYPWGTESLARGSTDASSYLALGNVQLCIASSLWLAFSLYFLRTTRSSIFAIFSIIAFLMFLTVCYVIGDIVNWERETIAAHYLIPGIGLFIVGIVLDRRGYVHYAVPLCVIGLILVVVCLSVLAKLKKVLIVEPSFLSSDELIFLNFMCNGVIYLVLAGICRLFKTRLQRSLAQILNWLGPIHILGGLRVLDFDRFTVPASHQIVYRTLLPIASIAFVFGSVARQMKSFFFSGLGGIALAVHKLTTKTFEGLFAWPVSLIITGIIWMFVSFLVPRWKASVDLKHKK